MRKLIINSGGSTDGLRAIREAGWDGVFTSWDPGHNYEQQQRDIVELGLIHHSVHAPYLNIHQLWEIGEEGDEEVMCQIACLQYAERMKVGLVILHPIIGMKRNTPTELGLERFRRIFNAAKALGVRVALENVEGEVYLDALMQAFPREKHVGLCLDTGHEICYNYGHDLTEKYGNRLFCTHFNDNMGMTGKELNFLDDSHMLPFDGIVDWQGVVSRLQKADYKGALVFEVSKYNRPRRHDNAIYEGIRYADFVKLAHERAVRLAGLLGD